MRQENRKTDVIWHTVWDDTVTFSKYSRPHPQLKNVSRELTDNFKSVLCHFVRIFFFMS